MVVNGAGHPAVHIIQHAFNSNSYSDTFRYINVLCLTVVLIKGLKGRNMIE